MSETAVKTAPRPWVGRLGRIALPSVALVAGGGFGALLRNRLQTAQLFAPDPYPLGCWTPEAYGLEVEDVRFEAEDGVGLHGWWMRQAAASGTVLYCHGNNGNVTNRIGVLKDLVAMGWNVLAFDYRGYGRSEGAPSEVGLCRDVRAAWDHLVTARGARPGSIVLFGHSLGGAVAIDGALHREVAGLVVQSSFTRVRDLARSLHPSLPLHLVARNQFRSVDKVGRLGMPKLFIHGTADALVPIELGRRLYQAAAEPKEWYQVEGAGHSELHRHDGPHYRGRLERFLERCLS